MTRKSVQNVESDLRSHERECEIRYQSILSQLEWIKEFLEWKGLY